jgi:hypothetical protein
MTPSVTYKVDFGRRPESRLTQAVAPPCAPTTAAAQAPDATAAATPIARLLATAHQVERLVEAGRFRDYRDAARQLGMCGSHLTHITNLLRLAPDIQQRLLTGNLITTERALRPVLRALLWSEQHDALTSISAGD